MTWLGHRAPGCFPTRTLAKCRPDPCPRPCLVCAVVLNRCSWTHLLEGSAHVYAVPMWPVASWRGEALGRGRGAPSPPTPLSLAQQCLPGPRRPHLRPGPAQLLSSVVTKGRARFCPWEPGLPRTMVSTALSASWPLPGPSWRYWPPLSTSTSSPSSLPLLPSRRSPRTGSQGRTLSRPWEQAASGTRTVCWAGWWLECRCQHTPRESMHTRCPHHTHTAHTRTHT